MVASLDSASSWLHAAVRTLLKRVSHLEHQLGPSGVLTAPCTPPGVHLHFSYQHFYWNPYAPEFVPDDNMQFVDLVQSLMRVADEAKEDCKLNDLTAQMEELVVASSRLETVIKNSDVPMPEEINMTFSDDFEFRDHCTALRTLSLKRYAFNLGIAILSNDFQSARLGLPTGLSPELQLQFDELYASPNFEVMDLLDKLSLPMIGTKREMIIRLLRHMAGTDD